MSTKKPVVVCVVNDESMLATVARCLEGEPFEIRPTSSSSQALSWVSTEEVAVLVSNYEMPEITGAQLAGHARRARPETVRILLTDKRALDGDTPFDHDVLRKTVRDGVERHRELLAMSGDREWRERREALRTALEAEYPGISQVERRPDEVYVVTADPWRDAAELGLIGLTLSLEKHS